MRSVVYVRRSMRWTGWILFVWLILSGTHSAMATLQVEGSLFWMTPDGDVAVGYHGVSGTRVDLDDDLGYDSAVPEGSSVPQHNKYTYDLWSEGPTTLDVRRPITNWE